MIEVVRKYPDGETELLEKHDHEGTISSFFNDHEVEWRNHVVQLVQVLVNGVDVYSYEWDSFYVGKDDSVEIVILPQGGIIKSVGKLLGGVVDFAFGWLLPSGGRGQQGNRYNTPQGERMDLADLKANQVRLGSTVPEIFGRHMRYFDHLNEPHRYFKDKRNQIVKGLMSVGVGHYEVEPLKVAFSDMQTMTGTSYKVFNPNEDLAGYYENWHTVKEVGATANGTAGIELKVDPAKPEDMVNVDPENGYTFSGTNGSIITRNDGTSFNQFWTTGISIEIGREEPYYHYTENRDNGAGAWGNVALIRGDFTNFPNDTDLTAIFPARLVNTIWGLFTARPVFYNKDDISNAVMCYEYMRGNSRLLTFDWQFYNYTFPTGETINIFSGSVHQVTDISGSKITVATDKNLTGLTNNTTVKIKYLEGSAYTPQWTNMYAATPDGVKTKEIEVDFFFPNGLVWISDEGWLFQNSAPLEVEVYDKLTGNRVFSQRKVYVDATNDQIGFTEKIILDNEIEPMVRVRRTERGFEGVQFHSGVVWYALKARLPDVKLYPKWTTVGVTVMSGGNLSAQSENSINAIVTRKLPVLQTNGEWSTPAPTRDIISAVKYISDQIGTDLDDEFKRLHEQYWKPRNEYFDYICDETTVRQAIDIALSAGMSDLTISNGKLKPVRDEKKTTIEQTYSAQNIIGNLNIDARLSTVDDFDGVEVEYVDDVTFDKKNVICSIKPQAERIKLRKVLLRGVTDRLRAWKIGMRMVMQDRYIRKDISFKTEMDGFNSEYGSYIGVVNDNTQYSQSCLILGVNGNTITLSEKVKSGVDAFTWRKRDGSLSAKYVVTNVDGNTITITGDAGIPATSLNKGLLHAFLGKSSKMMIDCIVGEVTPNGLENATIKANNYDDRVYTYDDYNEVVE